MQWAATISDRVDLSAHKFLLKSAKWPTTNQHKERGAIPVDLGGLVSKRMGNDMQGKLLKYEKLYLRENTY